MNRNDLRPLHAAIKASLRAARSVNSQRAASSVTLVALSAAAWMPQAVAADYTASNFTELRNAIIAANASADPSSTITLTNSITLPSVNNSFTMPTKSITIDTQGFVLSGNSGGSNGGITFVSANFPAVVMTVNGAFVGGNSGGIGVPGAGLSIQSSVGSTGQVINNGSITGGNALVAAKAGGVGVFIQSDATLVNNGTISSGTANAYSRPPGSIQGHGVSLGRGSTLINNAGATVLGGNSQGIGAGAGLHMNASGAAITATNYGTIRGGSDLTGVAVGNAAVRGLSSTASMSSLTNFGLLEGGNRAAAISEDGSTWNIAVVNSGTIRAGAGHANAIVFGQTAASTSTLELHAGSIIEGNVIASAPGANDTLRLGGDVDAVFASDIGAAAQYQNFDHFEKTGASTWTLTGTSTIASPWNIQQGTLRIGDGGTSGSIIGGVTNNGALAFNRSDTLTFGGIISGAGAVSQIGAGTTVLTGASIYSGGTTISAGTLQLGNGGTGGSIIGNVTNNGALVFNRSDTLTFGGAISGTGAVSQIGTGTTILTANNTYGGATTISAGALQLGNGGTSGSIGGDVLDNGTLTFNRSDALTFGGVISGTGSVTQIGSGTTILTGNNSYAGGTTISAGTLRVGDGGSSGSLGTGDVLNNGTLTFNRSDALTVAGGISGTGSVNQVGTGTTILSGDNTYAGGTTISAGKLQLGNGGTSGSLAGNVTNNGTLAFNRSDALAYDGVIGGNGTVRQLGAGTITLSAAGSNASTLDVQAGTLELTNTASLSATTMSIAAGATLSNDGMLTGTAGSDTFALAGTFIGSVSLLDGDDQVQIADGANFSDAAFDGGAGVDTLDLTNSSAFTLPQTLATSFEGLVKRGSGALTLSGTVDGFRDSITIAAGGVHLDNASIQTNEMRIDSGVTVTGTGSVSGSLNNAGLLSPGNSPGTIHVGGNYTQQASGTLISEITRTGTDLLDIAGSATLAGTHQIQVDYGLYLDGTTQTLIQAAGGITADFASEQMNLSALMEATRELSASALTVRFERQPFTSLTDLSDGRERFATYLEEQLAAGNVDATMTDYIDTLLQQPTDEQVANLLGERAEPVASVTQNNISILGAGFASTVFERFTLNDTAQCSPTQQGSNDTLNCFWAHGLRQWGNASGDARYDWTTDGGQIGVDRTLSSEFALGATFGYADTGISDLNGGRNDLRSRMGGLYANYASGRLTLGALAFYSGNESETRRSVLVGSTRQQARADFDGDSYGASVRLGYRLTSDAGPLVRPYIEAFYDRVDATRFAETGAGAGNLSARMHGRDGLRGTLGLQLADDFVGYGKVFRPALEVGVAHHFEDVRSTIDLQPFSDAPAFRTYGPALDRTSYIARASLNVSLGKNASVALGYGGELSDDYSQHEGNLSFRVAW